MAENVNLDVGTVLTVFANLRDRSPDSIKRTEDVLKLILNREGFMPADLETVMQPLITQIQSMLSIIQTTNQKIGDLMADIKDVGLKLDSMDAKAQKAFAEIRKALDDALASQITPDEMQAAVDQAIAATTAKERADAQAALDPIMAKLDTLDASLTTLDDVVPDAASSPTTSPVTQPVENPPAPPEETL